MDDEHPPLITPSQRHQIQSTVLQILKVSDFDTATEFTVRASAAQTLGFQLSTSAQRRLVEHLIDSYLLSNADFILGTPHKNDDAAHNKVEAVNVQQQQHQPPKQQQHQQLKSCSLGSQPNLPGNVICKLSNRRWVTIHESYGLKVVSLRDFIPKDGNMLPSKAANAGINLTSRQWSSFKKSFPSIEEAIAKLESRLGARSKQAVPPLKDSNSGSVAKLSEAELQLSNPVADSFMEQSESGTEISNLAEKVHSPIKRKHQQNESVVNLKTPNPDFSGTVHQGIKRRHTEVDTSLSANASNSQEPVHAERNPEEAPGSITGLESEENAHSRKSHSGRLIPIQPGRFDGTNFHSWRHQMGFFLHQLNIAYVLDMPCPSKSTNPEANFEVNTIIQRWIDDNYLCRHNILSSLSDSLYQLHSQKAQSAKELWEELNSMYKDDYVSKRSEINRYVHFQMADGVSILNQVRELDRIGNSIMASGTKIDEEFHVGVIIAKLPPSWKEVRVKLMNEKFVSYNGLIHCLEAEEKARHWKRDDGNEGGVGRRKWESKARVCFRCGKEGHVVKFCPDAKLDGGKRTEEEENA